MICPNCGNENCELIQEISTSGNDYSVCKGLCGACILQSWIGLLCGLCGEGHTTVKRAFWICKNCGYKFKA